MPSLPAPLSIALIGLGSAGKARWKAVQASARFSLKGIVSRRPEVASIPLEEALADPSLEAIAISTENVLHADLARRGLAARKHVLCDYPLALSEKEARELFDLAQKNHRVLHVEQIGLLSLNHQRLREEVQKKGRLVHGKFSFEGGWNSSLADPRWSGPFPFLASSRLLQMADLFGNFAIEESRGGLSEQGAFLELLIRFEEGGRLEFSEKRRAGLARRKLLEARCERGELGWPNLPEEKGLFAKDLEYFYQRVRNQGPSYYSQDQMLWVLKILEQLKP